MKHIDVRADTGTELTTSMRSAILDAYYADHVYGEDLNVVKLQKMAAQLFGKEAASFVISGVFANQAAIMTAGSPGTEILLCDKCHLITYQNGSIGRLSRMMTRTIGCDSNLFMSPEAVEANIRKIQDMQAPKQTILAIENPTSVGRVYPLDQFRQLIKIGKQNGLHVHMDGARIFNACAQLQISPKELAQGCDTVSFCLSKGLCTPIGSIVVGTRKFIDEFNVNRKMLGGMLRKPGQIAAMGIIALSQIPQRMKEAHKMALFMGEQLARLKWVSVYEEPKIETTMVFFKFTDERVVPGELAQFLRSRGVVAGFQPCWSAMNRFMTHEYIKEKEVEALVAAMEEYFQAKCNQGQNIQKQ